MKTFLAILIPLFLGYLVSCSKANEWMAENAGPEKTTRGNDTISIVLHDTARISDNNTKLAFDTVFNDSRCPQDVVCIWAGAYRVGISVISGREIQHIKLGTYPGQIADTTIQGVRISLLDLLPYPVNQKPVPPAEIKVKLSLAW